MKKSPSQGRLRHKSLLWDGRTRRYKLNVHRAKLLPLIYPRSGDSVFFRRLEHVFQPFMFLTLIDRITSSDVILVYSPPLLLGYLGSILGKLLNIPTIVNVQDIHPDALVDLGLLNNPVLIKIFEVIERLMYKFADVLTVHGVGNKNVVVEHGVSPNKVLTVHNACYIPPLNILREGNQFRQKYSLENSFVVTYAGIMSSSQDLHTIVEAAKLLSRKLQDVVFVLAGNGPEREELEFLIKKLKVSNILLLPFQASTDYWQLLAASDVCLVPLKRKVKTPVIPRKLMDIMAAARPVVANVPLDGDVPSIIEKAGSGMVVEPENTQVLAQALKRIHDMNSEDRLRMGQNGRFFALRNFSIGMMAGKYEAIFLFLKG